MSAPKGLPLARGIGALTALSIIAAPAWGQDATSASKSKNVVVLDNIVVKGERVERSLSDTAASVVVITEDEIEKDAHSTSVKEIIQGIPNVYMPGTVGAPTIRGQATQGPNSGVGAFFGGTVPRASITVDGRNLSYNEFYFGSSPLFDVERVEVFRGPQTTSQGANSIAGAIIVTTKDPSFTPEGSTEVRFGSGKSRSVGAALSGPIIENELAARIALDYYARDTYVTFTNPKFDPGAADPDISTQNGRFKLLWQPNKLPDLEAKLTYTHHESNGPQGEGVNAPFDDLEDSATGVVSWPISSDSVVSDITYGLSDGVSLTNQLQYAMIDAERLYNPMTAGSAYADQDDIANETRINFDALSGRASGVAGIFVRSVESTEYLAYLGDNDFDDTKESLGIYTELTYRLTDRWSVTGGVRYQHDKVERSGSSDSVSGDLDYSETFDAVLPKVSVAYDVTPDVTVGALVNKGYNPGGIGLSFKRGEFVGFDPETVWNYELFSRASLLNDRLSFTSNLFYSEFEDAQRQVVAVLDDGLVDSITVNAEKARSYGLELGTSFQATEGLRIYGSAGLLRTEITEFSSAVADYEGNEFEHAPEYMFTVGVDWNVTDQWNVAANVRRVGGYFSDDLNTDTYAVDPYTVANAQVSFKPFDQDSPLGDNLEVFGYVTNIFDDTSATSISFSRGTSGLNASVVKPREVGLGLRARF